MNMHPADMLHCHLIHYNCSNAVTEPMHEYVYSIKPPVSTLQSCVYIHAAKKKKNNNSLGDSGLAGLLELIILILL